MYALYPRLTSSDWGNLRRPKRSSASNLTNNLHLTEEADWCSTPLSTFFHLAYKDCNYFWYLFIIYKENNFEGRPVLCHLLFAMKTGYVVFIANNKYFYRLSHSRSVGMVISKFVIEGVTTGISKISNILLHYLKWHLKISSLNSWIDVIDWL